MDKYNPPDDFLPESYTCFFLLKMPRYSCKRVLKEKLTYAIHFCKSIGKFWLCICKKILLKMMVYLTISSTHVICNPSFELTFWLVVFDSVRWGWNLILHFYYKFYINKRLLIKVYHQISASPYTIKDN